LSTITCIDDAKGVVADFLTKKLSKLETEDLIKQYESINNKPNNLDLELSSLRSWLHSEELRDGSFHQGINALFLEMIEVRALFYAFIKTGEQNLEFFENEIFKTVFFQQWKVGCIYLMYESFSKLVSYKDKDKSLIKLWPRISSFLPPTVDEDEVELISKVLCKTNRQFVNARSGSIKFRNKVIAHNQLNEEPELLEFDREVQKLSRVWAILVLFYSEGIIQPFRKAGLAFYGFDKFFEFAEMRYMYKFRQEYLDKIDSWARTRLHNGSLSHRGPIVKISVKMDFRT
jgi:hypothetical protein